MAVGPHISELDKEDFVVKGFPGGTETGKLKKTRKNKAQKHGESIDLLRKEEWFAFADFSGWRDGSVVKIILMEDLSSIPSMHIWWL